MVWNVTIYVEVTSEMHFLGLSFSRLHHIPRRPFSRLSEKAFKLFRLKPSEVKRAKELEKLLQPLRS